ncbi:MAG TPA: ribonuclease R [Chthoniobacterales bacterium]|jgi:ribonuclease R|nr:ribonuclease R [Chthoniobacterales bacterium]
MTQDGRKIREKVHALLARKDYRPLDKIDIAHKLDLTGSERVTLRKILRELESSGEIARIRKNRYVLPAEADLVTGTLSIHQAGYGFLTTETSHQPDIFIAAENTGTAMHGDRVVARITRGEAYVRAKDRRGRREGRVIRILERARDTIVGTLQDSRNFYYVVPDDPRLVHNVYVQLPARAKLPKTPERGDKVVVRLEPWESRHVNPEGEIIELLGPASAPGVDMLSIIRKYDLPTEFPRAVVDEANRIPETVNSRMLENREDLREKFIVTIDPDDARDFDDAIQVAKTDNQGWRLGVHIADVSAYVNPDSALDREARRRGNSVYLPDRVIPMLPERLSNGVCSLNPGVDRLTHSVFIQFDKSGNAKNVRFAKSVIRSAHRLTYKQAYSILQSAPGDRLSEHLHVAWELASLLRRRRFERGSLDLDFPEVKVHVDANGERLKLERVENDESHQLVEEYMLAANEAVARELKKRAIPTIYRVHENPDPEKLEEYREFARSFNYKVGDLTHRAELQHLLASIRGKPEEQALKIALLKSLKRARYFPQPLGHYGLAKNNYAHFTSPIRRYADLVVHRALAERDEKRRSRTDMSQIASVAEHISTTERVAAEAEIEAVRMKKLEFFQRQLDERNPQVFHAAIIDVRNYGMVVELPDVLITGLIHVSSLTDDFYVFEPVQRRLIGRRFRRRLKIGDELRVFVARVDRFKRQIDFALADQQKNRARTRRLLT